MRCWSFILLFPLALATTFALGAQRVGGLSVDYQPVFQLNSVKSQNWLAKMTPEMQSMLRQFQVFEAAGSAGISEVRLLKFHYNSKILGNIDDAAIETTANINRLSGIKNPTQNIVPIKVSGRTARRISFESGRYDGKLGAEFLIIQDEATQTFYQLQIIFSKKPGINSFAILDLQDERALAQKILASVSIPN